MKKRFLLVIFCLATVMLFTLSGCSDKVEEVNAVDKTTPVSDFEYESDSNGGIIITNYMGNGTEVVIPEKIDDKYVTEIGPNAFDRNSTIVSVKIPAHVTKIDEKAFRECEKLEEVSLPDNLESIDDDAFAKCPSLGKISLPNSLRNLGAFAFYECTSLKKITIHGSLSNWEYSSFVDSGLEEIIIEEGITEIPFNSFYGTKLKEVKLPDSVRKIDFYAFSCETLEKIILNQGLISINDYAFQSKRIKELIIPESVTDMTAAAFFHCPVLENVIFQGNAPKDFMNFNIEEPAEFDEPIVVPNKFTVYYNKGAEGFTSPIWNGYKTAEIGGKPTIPVYKDYEYLTNSDNTITIFRYAGKEESITIPSEINGKKVTILGEKSFADNDYIVNVTVPDTVTTIETAAFYHCSMLKTVALGKNVQSMGAYAFCMAESLSEINLPNGLKTMGKKAFLKCQSLKQIRIPGTVKVIETSTFRDTILETVTFEEGVETIGYHAFAFNKIKKITFPQSIKTISDYAFANNPLENILLNEGLESIKPAAFDLTSLKELVIPKTVKDITEWALCGVDGLQKVKFEGDAPEAYIEERDRYKNSTYTVYYHEGAKGFTSPEWNGYKTEIW